MLTGASTRPEARGLGGFLILSFGCGFQPTQFRARFDTLSASDHDTRAVLNQRPTSRLKTICRGTDTSSAQPLPRSQVLDILWGFLKNRFEKPSVGISSRLQSVRRFFKRMEEVSESVRGVQYFSISKQFLINFEGFSNSCKLVSKEFRRFFK